MWSEKIFCMISIFLNLLDLILWVWVFSTVKIWGLFSEDQYASKFGKLSSGHRTGKGVFIPIPKKGSAKECSNYHTIALISQASKVMLKILQARLQQYMNRELPHVYAGCRKGRGTRDQIANIRWIMEKNWTWNKDWFQIGKGVYQGCILSPCLFNFYAEHIMRNTGPEDAQAGIKIARGNINNLR